MKIILMIIQTLSSLTTSMFLKLSQANIVKIENLDLVYGMRSIT